MSALRVAVLIFVTGASAHPALAQAAAPVPSLSSISPSSAAAGGPSFRVTVNGAGFVARSTVRWNGADRTTAFVSSAQLTATIGAADIAAPGTAQVTVFTSAPGGGTSPTAPFTVNLTGSSGWSLRFHGNGTDDIDRVKIPIDDPTTTAPSPPANVGSNDFTLEFWMKGLRAENAPVISVTPGFNHNWIFGNIIFDRDRFNQDRKFGVSIGDGNVAFGVTGNGPDELTILGAVNVLDGRWHHVAIERRVVDGAMWVFVDGILDAQGAGPIGDVSYPYHAVPGSFCGPTMDQPCTNSDPFLVIGAEKHDAGTSYPSFSGWVAEVRLSSAIRYVTNFAPATRPFAPDASALALWHLDEGTADFVTDTASAPGGPSMGVRRFGGTPAGPEWVRDSPFP